MSELTESLRYCATNNSCEFCPRHKYQYDSVIACAEQMLNEAADTIENQNNLLDLNTQRCEALRDQLRDSHESYEKHLNEIESQVPRWIPVTERMPEESGYYLVCCKTGMITDMHFSAKHQLWNVHDHSRNLENKIAVSHWTPLPDPPDLT